MRPVLGGIFDDFTYDTGLDNWGDWYAAPDPNQSAYDMEYANYAGQALQSARTEVESRAASGTPVSAAAAETLRTQGLDLNNIITNAAGAAFKLVQQSNGTYIPQPINAQAQQVASSAASRSKMLIIGGGLLALFAFMH